ncbi:MAG: efflux RND transporter permease subunit [bacterium]|nr:efflux RND transporter permease subunit [bacterium]MBU1916543.1 efflux RND transporter permease subunit [bacterium]
MLVIYSMQFLAKFSVKNTLLINLLFVFIILAGYFAVTGLQRQAFPNIDFDMVLITTYYPGTTPAEMEKLITIPIEKELKDVDDIKEMTSVSSEGISVITLKLEENVSNKDRVINDIQRAVDRTEDLPDDLQDKPIVKDVKTKNRPIIEVALSGDISEDKIREYAKTLEKKFLEIPEVARVDFKGLRDYEISVEVLPETLSQNHLSIQEIAQALSKQNRAIPGGKFYHNNQEYLLRTTGEFIDVEGIKNTIVRASPLGTWIHVGDIAKVTKQFQEETVLNRTQGTRSINLVIVKKENGDAIDMVDKIHNISNAFLSTADPNLQVNYLNDLSYFIKRRQNVLINNGIIGMIMVIILLFTFLSVRTAIAAFIGIPTAIFLTFISMSYLGITFNLIAMFGLIMVLGMLVDEDIVISENIFRHLEKGDPADVATINGVTEVAWPLITTVLTTIAAFTPLMIMGGIMGKFLKHIPIVLTIALGASLIQAMIILPSHIYHLNSGRLAPEKRKDKRHERFNWWKKHYLNILNHLVAWRYPLVILLLISFVGSIYFAKSNMRFILFPSKGIETLHVKLEGFQGDSLQIMADKISRVEKIIETLNTTELKHYATNVGIIQQGSHDPMSKILSHVGQIIIYLTPESDRKRTTQEITNDLRTQSQNLQGFSILDFENVRMGPPVGKPIQIRIRGEDFHVSEQIANTLVSALENIEGVNDIKDDYELDKDEYRIIVDPVRAAQTGLTVEDIAKTVRHAFDGNMATKIKFSEEEIDVIVKYPTNLRYDYKALTSLVIPNNKGNLIKIDQVATFEKHKGVLSIKHFDSTRTINVTANINESITSPLEVSNIIEPKIKKAEQENVGYTILFGGELQETQESLHNMFNALYLAAALILFILIAMLRSLIQPFIIMITIPFSIIGIIMAFYLHGEALSFMALMGVIGMTGVVVDSGILMIDYMNKLKKQAMDGKEAILQAATIRLRAIILTTLTTFFGIIPAAYGLGGVDPFIKPMALALNYGIVSGAIITIFFLPLFLYIVEDIKELFSKLYPHKPSIQ